MGVGDSRREEATPRREVARRDPFGAGVIDLVDLEKELGEPA